MGSVAPPAALADWDHISGFLSYNVRSSQLKPIDDAIIRRLRFEVLKPASQPSRVCSSSLSSSRTYRIKRTCVSLPRKARRDPRVLPAKRQVSTEISSDPSHPPCPRRTKTGVRTLSVQSHTVIPIHPSTSRHALTIVSKSSSAAPAPPRPGAAPQTARRAP